MENIKKSVIFFIPIFVWLFYSWFFFEWALNKNTNNYNYFKFLSFSILQGRFDIDCPSETQCHDLVEYKGKYYLYWPWVPAIIFLPFVAIVGTNISDILISSIFGAFNIFLIIILIRQLSLKFNLEIKDAEVILLSLFWGLGTVHFYMSMVGSVWFISQIMAQTFLLSSMILVLVLPDFRGFFLSGLFYSMAVYTKNDLIFSILFIIAIWIFLKKENKNINYHMLIIFLLPFLFFSILNFIYNYIRFENIFENGIKYHKMDFHFKKNYINHGYLSFYYIPYNFLVEVLLPPPFKTEYPFFDYNPEGFGFLWNSPLFFLTIPIFVVYFKKIFKKENKNLNIKTKDMILLTGSFLSLLFISLIIFSIMGTGRVQFASRYSLDYQIF
ncbi:MAG: hypothetical protein N3E50_01630, partial [Candidatus Goldbacteria bacterium]|nr:hypothetical protein [Candidatus Goldiibacteriota bacterium]